MNGGGIPWPKAWTISGVTGSLGAADFVAGVVAQFGAGLQNFLPAVIFIIAVLLAFNTGTSWGTFGILIPIVLKVFPVGADGLPPHPDDGHRRLPGRRCYG